MLGFGMVAPVFPRLVVLLEGGNAAAGAAIFGVFATVFALMQFVMQGLVVGCAVARLGEWRALAAGLVLGATGLATFALAPTGWMFAIGIPLWALFGLANPSLMSLLSRRVAETEQGRLQGALASLRGIASLVAPVLFTGTFALAVGSLRGLGLPGAPFLLAIVLLLGGLALATRVKPREEVAVAAAP